MAPTNYKDQGLVFKKGKWWPLSALLIIPFMFLFLPLYRVVRSEVNWKAAWATVILFEVVMFLAEAFSISRGHWVWNESRIFGYKIWGVPIEEPLIYYWFPIIFVIALFHAFKKGWTFKRKTSVS